MLEEHDSPSSFSICFLKSSFLPHSNILGSFPLNTRKTEGKDIWCHQFKKAWLFFSPWTQTMWVTYWQREIMLWYLAYKYQHLQSVICINLSYITGLLNAWIWFVDECFRMCSYFQRNAQIKQFQAGLDHITVQYHFAKPFLLFLSKVLQQKIQNPLLHWPSKYI